MEYLIRFQNTGNAPAQSITIRDTLDTNLDLSTFQMMANSHSVITTIDENSREISFYFPDIQLPDSTCCEEDSHGLVSFKIRPYPDLAAGTEINNTSYIFFDNNPPIITNTTWTTIHQCSEGLTLSSILEESCPVMNMAVGSDYVSGLGWNETFIWKLNGDAIASDETADVPLNLAENSYLELVVENPLCTESTPLGLVLDAGYTWATCEGDLNCDLECNSLDVLDFLGEFGCAGPMCSYDFNADESADSTDLLSILGTYGTLCE